MGRQQQRFELAFIIGIFKYSEQCVFYSQAINIYGKYTDCDAIVGQCSAYYQVADSKFEYAVGEQAFMNGVLPTPGSLFTRKLDVFMFLFHVLVRNAG